jgi:hypothetical protein
MAEVLILCDLCVLHLSASFLELKVFSVAFATAELDKCTQGQNTKEEQNDKKHRKQSKNKEKHQKNKN